MNDVMSEQLTEYLDGIARDERYVVDAVLKEGTFEITQRVFFLEQDDSKTGPYIRKYINKDSGLGKVYERIFEAQKSGIELKYLPKIIDYYEMDDQRVVVMEYVEGQTLTDLVYSCDPSVELAQEIFPSLCDAVSELHEKFDPPIIHRDLKPSNFIISDDRPVIIDFGIARIFKVESDTDTQHFGTRAYAPPEQFGFGQTDVRSDVYALGMLLYFCLTEKTPDQQARDLDYAVDGVPKHLSVVITQATAFDPADRYNSAAELKSAFLDACNLESALQTSRPIQTESKESPGERLLVSETFDTSHERVKTKRSWRVPKTSVGRIFTHIPFAIGVIWDILIFLLLIAFLVACILFIVSPDVVGYPEVLSRSMAYRVFTYVATFFIFVAIGCAICDRRPLIRLFPRLIHVSTVVEVVICIVVIIVMAAIVYFSASLP